jgi:mannose-6-phosphate isomerase-like protein (cupin superfamily)
LPGAGRVARRLLVLILLLSGCTLSKTQFSYYHPAPQEAFKAVSESRRSLLHRVKELGREEFENIRLETLAENELSSHHLVIIRQGEPLHYHAQHDGWAMVLKGRGEFLLGQSRFRLSPGSSFFIPRGTVHQAVNEGQEPLAAFVIFTPPYDGTDFVVAEST